MPVRTVHIIDDDRDILDSISFMLRLEGYEICAHLSATSFLSEMPSLASACLLTELRLPGLSGIGLLEKMREDAPFLPVILMTSQGDVTSAVRAMKSGAVDFLQKPFSKADLLAAIRAAEQKSDHPIPSSEARQDAERRVRMLTKREQEVLAALAHGFANKTIAYDLGISARTVEVHRANAMKKLGVHSLPELLHLAFLAGIMETICYGVAAYPQTRPGPSA